MEQVDARNWLRNDSAEQVEKMNNYDKNVDAIINDSINQVDAISDSKKLVVTRSDPKSDPISNPKLDTHTTNENFGQKSLISRFVPNIIPIVIRPINPPTTANVMGIQRILSLDKTVFPKERFTGAARSCVQIFRGTPGKVRRTSREDISSKEHSRLSSQGPSCIGNSISPTRTGNQDIFSPSHHPSISKRGRNDEPFDASINGFLAVNDHSTSYFSGVSVWKYSLEKSPTSMRAKG